MSSVLPVAGAAFDLRSFNTLALPSQASGLRVLTTESEVDQAHAECLPHAAMHVLGGGSNVVLAPHIDAEIWHMAMRGIHLLDATPTHWLVQAAAGERWHHLVQHCVAAGWGGLENLALIPGTVGAAPVQNIGAYGVELAEFVDEVRAFDRRAGQWCTLAAPDCGFAYRDSVFKREPGRWVISSVVLRLPRQWQARLGYPDLGTWPEWQQHAPTPAGVFEAVCAIRRRKLPDPALLPNAGSFFKNPVVPAAVFDANRSRLQAAPHWPQADGGIKLAAGWLIEACGWKGRRLGPVGMHERHALVLVNHGGATGNDVRLLARAVQAEVRQQFGVWLEAEPVWLGFD